MKEARRELAELASDLRRRLVLSERDADSYSGVSRARSVRQGPAPASASPAPPPPSATKDVAAALLEEAAKVAVCRSCPLGKTRIKPAYGVGSPTAQVIFIGEGPGYAEDHQGEPFVGRAGQLLDKILASIGLSRQTVYIANVVKCHPMIRPDEPESRGNDRPPTPEEAAACRPYLDRQIELIRPKVLVTLGAVAARAVLNTTQGISKLRGQWQTIEAPGVGPLKVLPTYHPAALLRNPNLKKEVWEDMKVLRQFLGGVQ